MDLLCQERQRETDRQTDMEWTYSAKRDRQTDRRTETKLGVRGWEQEEVVDL